MSRFVQRSRVACANAATIPKLKAQSLSPMTATTVDSELANRADGAPTSGASVALGTVSGKCLFADCIERLRGSEGLRIDKTMQDGR
jgi:hypothetical protein